MPTDVPPLVVDLVRGPHVESSHLVHAALCDADGTVVRSWGDPEHLTHPRSAVKPIQAFPLVETGAADAFDLGDTELALACASHNGEPGHLDAVEAWLARIGCSVDDLECGIDAERAPTPSANNCSGKHAGFLTVARHLGVDPAGYIQADHPVQRLVTEALSAATGVELALADAGIDGCGIPVHPVPLRAIAAGGARLGTPPGDWPSERREAARRLGAAMAAEPWLVAGNDRLCTHLLRDAAGAVLVKVGAEGVQLAALPGHGLGIAIKAVDGSRRASEIALGHVLAEVEGRTRTDVFDPLATVTNHAGTAVATLVVRD